MMHPATQTVRELVIERPHATRIFEQLRIDYCCGGGRPLAEACAAAGVEVETIMRLLEETPAAHGERGATRHGQTASLSALMTDIVETHHRFTRHEIARLSALIEKVCAVHGPYHPELLEVQSLFHALCHELGSHMDKEEHVLFPYIGRMEAAATYQRALPPPPFGTVRNPVQRMLREHDAAGDMLRSLRAVSVDYAVPSDGCLSDQTLYQALAALEADLHQHIHLENNILFPRAVAMETMLSVA